MPNRTSSAGSSLLRLLFCVAAERCNAYRISQIADHTLDGVSRQNFMDRLSDILEVDVPRQKQPAIYYDAGDQAEFRQDPVRCEPSFSKAPGVSREFKCKKLAILLHGFTSCPGMWYAFQPRLSTSGFCVLRATLPGHGYQPYEVDAFDTVALKIDQPTWTKMNKLSDGQVSRPNERFKFYTGLYVERPFGPLESILKRKCKPSCYIVNDVKPGKFYEFNTLVSQHEVPGNLDMILKGDVIYKIKPKEISSFAHIDEHGELIFGYSESGDDSMNATEYWDSSFRYIEIELMRPRLEDDTVDMPTGQTWHAYVDFADRLGKFAAAFRQLQPQGVITMMGHSLGAATATAAMIHAESYSGGVQVFDRVLVLNPAFGVSSSFGWALKSIGQMFSIPIDDEKCQRTRRTLSMGGYCKFTSDHARAVHEFGRYAVCSLIAASSREFEVGKLPLWCRSSFKERPLRNASGPLATDMELVTTTADPAISDGLFSRAVEAARSRMGKEHVGSCYLHVDLGHNFINELASTKKRDFWWKKLLLDYVQNFFEAGTQFPVLKLNTLMCAIPKPGEEGVTKV